jgi:hypothetical protein
MKIFYNQKRAGKRAIILLIVLPGLFAGSLSAQTLISSFSPVSGPVGSTVTINGSGFDLTTTNNTVYVGSVKAAVVTASVTSLTVTIPAGGTYQPITVINTVTGKSGTSNLCFNITFPSAGAFTISSFAAKVDRATANAPLGIAVGDINGDGLPDVVVVNSGSNSVSVFKNTSTAGAINFAPKVDFATANSPSSLTLGDYNGDGKLDIMVTNTGSNSVSVIRNTSTVAVISFAGKQDFITGNSPSGVSLKDINADGLPDMVVSNRTSNTISVFKNLGGLFAPKSDFATGTSPLDAGTADIDGDGKPDVLVPDDLSAAFSTLRNTSAGAAISFAAKIDNSTPSQPRMINIGDLDGDGKQDIVTPNFLGNNFSAFRNTSSTGIISYAARQDFAAGTQTLASFIADLDGDGLPDVITVDAATNSVGVYKNNSIPGTISFAAPISYTTGTGPQKIFVADLDLDGKPDIITINSTSNTFSVLRNTLLSSLPVILQSFTGSRNGTEVSLSWQTSEESNTKSFEAEQSTDGNQFSTIVTVAASGNSNGIRQYNFVHHNPAKGINYYRLKMIDLDGSYSFSKIISVQMEQVISLFTIYPNPAHDFIIIKPGSSHSMVIHIFASDGLQVKSYQTDGSLHEINIPISNLPAGFYTVQLQSGGGSETQTFIKK